MKFKISLLLAVFAVFSGAFAQEEKEGRDTTKVSSPQDVVAILNRLIEQVDSSKALQTNLKIEITFNSVTDSTALEQLVISNGIKGPFVVIYATEEKRVVSISYERSKDSPANGTAISETFPAKTTKSNLRLKGDY